MRARGTNEGLRNTKFTGMRVKDAVCDRLREVRGGRPDVNVAHPDIAIDVRIHEGKAAVSVELVGFPKAGKPFAERVILTLTTKRCLSLHHDQMWSLAPS